MTENNEAFADIIERQKRMELGLLILSSQVEDLIGEMRAVGADNLPAKFCGCEWNATAFAFRDRESQAADRITRAAAAQAIADRYGPVTPTSLPGRQN